MTRLLVAGLALALAGNAAAKELPFKDIRVSYQRGTDIETLPTCDRGWNRPVDRLGVEVRNADVYVQDVEVRFHDRDTVTIPIRDTLETGRPVRYIALGDTGCVSRIELIPDPHHPRPAFRRQPIVEFRGVTPDTETREPEFGPPAPAATAPSEPSDT